jgi:hypothetical protein
VLDAKKAGHNVVLHFAVGTARLFAADAIKNSSALQISCMDPSRNVIVFSYEQITQVEEKASPEQKSGAEPPKK